MALTNLPFIAKALRRGRFALNRHGYDLHPIDGRCWEDQSFLLRDRAKKVILDVGAHRGETARKYRALFPDSKIFSFEPQADLASNLKREFESDRKISVHRCAVGETDGTANFYLNAKRDTSSLLSPDSSNLSASYSAMLANENSYPVDVISLDSFCSLNGLSSVDLLKLDIQGGEYNAIKGAQRLLSNHKVDLIYSEVYFIPMYTDQPLFGDIAGLLAKWDYKVHLIYNQTVNGISGRPLWGDALFVPPQLYTPSRERLRTSWIK